MPFGETDDGLGGSLSVAKSSLKDFFSPSAAVPNALLVFAKALNTLTVLGSSGLFLSFSSETAGALGVVEAPQLDCPKTDPVLPIGVVEPNAGGAEPEAVVEEPNADVGVNADLGGVFVD